MFNWLSLKICYTIKHFFSFVNNEFPVFKIDAYMSYFLFGTATAKEYEVSFS